MQTAPAGALFDRILSFEHDPTDPPAWVDMWDNGVISWLIDETGMTDPQPVIIGTLPAIRTTGTEPIISPQWAMIWHGGIIVPNLWRGSMSDFWTWLATNNGADRQLRGNFIGLGDVQNSWSRWAGANPNRVWPGPGP